MTFGAGMLGQWGIDSVNRIADNEFMEEDRNQRQEFSASQVRHERDWQTYMSNTAHQREMSDYAAAGLNPILTVGSRGASMGSVGGVGNSSSASTSRMPSGQVGAGSQAFLVSSQADLNSAAAEKARAEALTERNRPENVAAQTESYRASAAKMRQEVQQSVQMVETLRAQAAHAISSAEAQQALGVKLKAELPQIAASVRLMQAQAKEIAQRTGMNLPEVEKRLKEAEVYIKNLQTPQHERMAEAWGTNMAGTLGALGKVLNPFADFFK